MMIVNQAINTLKQYARDHYEQGGHWVYECYDRADYADVLVRAAGGIERAKQMLKEDWELTESRAQDCKWD
jgi:hypothetical protein